MAQKYRIKGRFNLDITAVVEAQSDDEATDVIETTDINYEGDGDIVFTSLNISRLLNSQVEDIGEGDTEGDPDDPDDIYRKYRVTGDLEIDFIAEVTLEPESGEDPTSKAEDNAEFSLGDDVNEENLCFVGSDYDDDPFDMNYDKWVNHMTKTERINFLVGLGCSDDGAYETAGFSDEDYDRIPEEWVGQLDV